MPLVRLQRFGGIAPAVAPELLADHLAQQAENCKLESGRLCCFGGLVEKGSLSVSNPKTIYKYNGNWLEWDRHVNVVRGPLADDAYDRIYYTGDGVPKMRCTINGMERVYELGVPAPENAPTATIEPFDINNAITVVWHYYYEGENGAVIDMDAETITATFSPSGWLEDTATRAVSTGVWTIQKPQRKAAPATAVFFPFADVYLASTGVYIGRIYADNSVLASSSSVELYGSKIRLVAESKVSDICVAAFFPAQDSTGSIKVAFRYVYTFVTELGEEGPPSEPSVEYIGPFLRKCRVTVPDIPDNVGCAPISKKRIYRLVTSETGESKYQYVGEVDRTETEFIDEIPDVSVGEVLPSSGWYAPPENLAGLVSVPGGFMAGFVDKTVYFSEPNYPHAWPRKYGVSVSDEIVALGVSGNTVYVLTKSKPYMITVSHPESSTVVSIPANQACVSARGVAEAAGIVLYPSPDGIVICMSGTAAVYSDAIIDKKTWSEMNPSEMCAEVFDGCAYMVSDQQALVFPVTNRTEPIISTLSVRPTAMRYVPEDDILYMAIGDKLYAWDADAEHPLTATWRSKKYVYPILVSPSTLRILADGYPVVVRLYANDTQVGEFRVNSGDMVRLPVLRRERAWAIETESLYNVSELLLGRAVGDL